MPRSFKEMIDTLEEVVSVDPNRKQSMEAARSFAETSAARIPLVHRTGKGKTWRTIFQSKQLTGCAPCTKWERESLKIDRATYFFWGCGAYPKGNVAILMSVPGEVEFTAAPFDSGGCMKGFFLRSGREMSNDERIDILENYTLAESASFLPYCARFLAAHFRDALDYIRRPQNSEPDSKPYHGLESATQDRRAWSVEVRVHGDVAVPPKMPLRVVLYRKCSRSAEFSARTERREQGAKVKEYFWYFEPEQRRPRCSGPLKNRNLWPFAVYMEKTN